MSDFKPYTAYKSVPVTYSATTDSTSDLERENAELTRMCERLMRENAELRKLVRVFYHCTTSGKCDYCPINVGGTVHLMPDTICDTLHDRMRELGVEMNG